METATTFPSKTALYCDLPLSQLEESPSNPRRRYHVKRLEELAQSFQVQGVLEPLLVRALGSDRFEIVAGSGASARPNSRGLRAYP